MSRPDYQTAKKMKEQFKIYVSKRSNSNSPSEKYYCLKSSTGYSISTGSIEYVNTALLKGALESILENCFSKIYTENIDMKFIFSNKFESETQGAQWENKFWVNKATFIYPMNESDVEKFFEAQTLLKI